MKMSRTQQMETRTLTSIPFTGTYAFEVPHGYFNSGRVYITRPPKSVSSRPWISTTFLCHSRHPLTSKSHSFYLDYDFHNSRLQSSSIAAFCAFGSPYRVDKLLVLPIPRLDQSVDIYNYTMFALYGGGQLLASIRYSLWVNLSQGGEKFDDIVVFQDKIYAVDRQGITKLVEFDTIISKINIGETVVSHPLTPGSGKFGWRKRFVVTGQTLYLVVRTEEKLFDVFRLKSGEMGFYWVRVWDFEGKNKVLFMARDYFFFLRASRMFPGREYKNCIVFSEASFPQYGNDCWKFTQSDGRQFDEEDIAVFRLSDDVFAREGENSGFPKIDWSPPDWILNNSSFPAAEFQKHTVSESSSSQSQSEADEDEGLDSDSGDKNDGEVQSGLKDTLISCEDQDQRRVQSYPDSQDQEDERMHSGEANIDGAASLPKDPVTPLSAGEEEITGTLLRMNSGNDAVTEETPGKNITETTPMASTSSRTEIHNRVITTAKFEGLDIRSDLVPILQKIWQKHGNIIKDSIVRSGDIVARALESLATMVRILEDNPVQSLCDSQADYLSSTLSDLRSIRFKVYWLISFVEEALKIHKSKSLVESLNNLTQLNSQVKERKAILLGELANLNEEENKLKEEMAKVSKMIPFFGQVKFDEPRGAGFK